MATTAGGWPLRLGSRYGAAAVARKKTPPISDHDREVVGRLLRDLRRAAGYRSVEALSTLPSCQASRQTIYAYERGGLTPNLQQFLELVDFTVLEAPRTDAAKPADDLRMQGVAAVMRALSLPVYHVSEALDLVARMQPAPTVGRRRRRP